MEFSAADVEKVHDTLGITKETPIVVISARSQKLVVRVV